MGEGRESSQRERGGDGRERVGGGRGSGRGGDGSVCKRENRGWERVLYYEREREFD